MAAPIFNRIETAEVKKFIPVDFEERDNIHDANSSHLVPDLSGDKIPDFIEVRKENTGKTHACMRGFDDGPFYFDKPKHTEISYEKTKWLLVLTEGKYNKLGGLVRSTRAYTLDSYVSTDTGYDKCKHEPIQGYPAFDTAFILPEVKDYDGDCSAELSYWKYIGKDSDYRQVIQKRK